MSEITTTGRTGDLAGRLVQLTPEDRLVEEVSRNLTPWDVDQILREANAGDPRRQAKLAQEILEKDWDIAQAVQTRAAAVIGTPWQIQPASQGPAAAESAACLARILSEAGGEDAGEPLASFDQLLANLLSAYLPGFAVSEIVWRDGGRGLAGFQFVPAHHFSFAGGSERPRLVTRRSPQGDELPRRKFVVHRYRHRSGDLARGGLIRPLAWLYCFKNLNLKDLLRYMEKFGMPFIAARLDPQAFESERRKIGYLIRNFGSDGGGVFTRGVELEFIQNQNQAGADLYFRFLDYAARAVSKLVLGQTATSDSQDANRSTASVHNLVRQDLRQDDCLALAETLRQDLLRPLVEFNFGPGLPVPRLVFACQAPPDLERESRVVDNLCRAGYRPEPAAIERRFGYRLAPLAQP